MNMERELFSESLVRGAGRVDGSGSGGGQPTCVMGAAISGRRPLAATS